nr:hypothetical protein GCM10017588_30040 [Microbispora rosea subsp. aerata]
MFVLAPLLIRADPGRPDRGGRSGPVRHLPVGQIRVRAVPDSRLSRLVFADVAARAALGGAEPCLASRRRPAVVRTNAGQRVGEPERRFQSEAQQRADSVG